MTKLMIEIKLALNMNLTSMQYGDKLYVILLNAT